MGKGMIDRERETIDEFERLQVAWLMQFNDGWWAFYNDEKPIGPFAIEAEAAQAGLDAWKKRPQGCSPEAVSDG